MIPLVIGSTNHRTATQLAEAAIERMPRGGPYAIGMDPAGRVLLAKPDDFHHTELLMVCTRTTDPDVLADNIRDETTARNKA